MSYVLLRGLGWLDSSLHGDVAVRRYLARFLVRENVSQKEPREWLSGFSPCAPWWRRTSGQWK